MDRDQAEKALGIIRGVIENTREDLVQQNWGLVWLVHSITNGLGFASIGLFVERPGFSLRWYLVPLAVVACVTLFFVAILTERDRGTLSYVEWQMHGIWTSFIIVTLGGAVTMSLAGISPQFFCPLIGLTSSFGFAVMGAVFYRRFFLVAALFLMLAILVSVPMVRPIQWYLMATAWWAAMFIPGLILFQEKGRRRRGERETRIL